MNKKFLVIGSGALGSAFANILIDAKQKNVLVYGINKDELNDLKHGKNTKYFGNEISFNKINVTSNIDEALEGVSYIVLAVPSIAIDSILNQIIDKINTNTLIINGCKGFYPGTETPLHSGIEEKIKSNKNIRGVVSILGPSFAIEMIKKSLTTIVAVSNDKDQLKEVQQIFYTNYFKLYGQNDVVGAEIGGIYKNILAIGAGMITEMGYTINTLASYLTRGLKEMSRFNNFMQGKNDTIYGLTGLGDLILTATDSNSRNFEFGKKFIRTQEFDPHTTIEGLTALKVVEKIRIKHNLYLPLQKAIYNVLFNNSNMDKEIQILWSSDLKDEN